MSVFPRYSFGNIFALFKSEKRVRHSFYLITGMYPSNLSLYKQAMHHSSLKNLQKGGIIHSYERLEYLGDSILSMIIAEYLFTQYPFEQEGFLTDIRSKIVNRESLNELAKKIGLKELVRYDRRSEIPQSVYGDCMEALIGAVYLDHGFYVCRDFVINKLVKTHFNMEKLISTVSNYKSVLIEWSQKEKKELHFQIVNKEDNRYTVETYIDDELIATGYGYTKKKAEKDAAEKAFVLLNLDK